MTYNEEHWKLQPAEQINFALDKLPKGEERDVFITTTDENGKAHGFKSDKYKAILVNNKLIDIPTQRYVLKQHVDAFRPIIEGLVVSGIKDFQFALWHTESRANLNIFVGEAEDGVKFGFKCTNSFDRSLAIHFGAKATQLKKSIEVVEKEHVLVWGYREICANGMIAKIPLKTCKYLDAVEVTKIKELLRESGRIIHIGKDIDTKLDSMQYVVEAFILLKEPLNRMIIDAKKHPLSKDEARILIKKYVGKRRMDRYLELYDQEEQSLWGLYNSITYLASHDDNLTTPLRERLLMDGANLLEAELMPEIKK